jgi:hypothetical protein
LILSTTATLPTPSAKKKYTTSVASAGPISIWYSCRIRIAGQAAGDLVVPLEMAPKDLTDGMGAEWRLKQKNRKVLEAQSEE